MLRLLLVLLRLQLLSALVSPPAPALISPPATTIVMPPASAHHCDLLQAESMEKWKAMGEYVVPQPQNVTVVWGTRVAHAAAALLRASLLAAGFSNVSTHYERASARLCDLLRVQYPPGYDSNSRTVVVVPATEADEAVARCTWTGGKMHVPGQMRVLGAGAAPAGARLHARLTAAARDDPRCVGATAAAPARFYRDAAQLSVCGFLSSSGMQESKKAIVYVLSSEWESAVEELTKRLVNSSDDLQLVIARQPLNRSELALLVAEAAHSFLFLDAELWADTPHVHVIEPLPATFSPRPRSLRVAEEYGLNVKTPTLYELFANMPQLPRPADLRTVLERADSHLFGGNVEEAACELARGYHAPEVFAEWRDRAREPVAHKALVILCKEDIDNGEYSKMSKLVGSRVYNLTVGIKLGISIAFEETDCLNPDWMTRDVVSIFDRYKRLWPSRMAGAVVPSNVAIVASTYLVEFHLPLLTYDVGADETSTAGHVADLALELRRFLGECASRRLAVLSELSQLSHEAWHSRLTLMPLRVAEELNACQKYEISMESKPNITLTLRELSKAGARVFLVNARAGAAARVLASALALNYTRAAGYEWVVLEYDAADDATRELEPYSFSFQWRGGEPPKGKVGEASEAGLREELEGLWPERAWPRHAAPIADALLTLGEGFKRLVVKYADMRDNPYTDQKLRYFWNQTRHKRISGIIRELAYDKNGTKDQFVFIYQWSNETRPKLVQKPGLQRCLVPESESNCYVRGGDQCHPRCDTIAWFTVGAIAVLIAVALVLTATAVSRVFKHHVASVRTKTIQRLLAGRERAFAVLAPHTVDRAALDRREELGVGNYGRVWRCFLRDPRVTRHQVTVAAKELLDNATPEEETRFLREACTLAALEHEHVVRFVGVCLLDGPPLLLLMEYALFGDLLRYLRARRHLAEGTVVDVASEERIGREEAAYVSAEALTRFAREAAEAVAFLAQRGLVHRDVRAANCLVNERRSLKLADFGLARALDEPHGEYAMVGPRLVPVRYWPPESLTFGVSSIASDVWSLGVLALELVTLGERPFGALPLATVVERVRAGGRPPLPRDASADTRRLLAACWQCDAARRPAAVRLAAWLGARPRALRPALDDTDTDSGFEEPPSTQYNDLDT